MKNITNIIIGLILVAFFTVSCEDMLETDSDQFVLPEDHQLGALSDTVYSMMGIYTQLQELGDRYVLLGELRGDLMDITSGAGKDIKEIYNFEISSDNKYNKASDYYSVINSCNYVIHNMDTSIVDKAEKVMYKEFAQAKAARAWTYMQLALNYGTVTYYDKPILSVADANKDYPEYNLNTLAPVLINDLLPFQGIEHPGGISLGDELSSFKLAFNVRYLLGELYLWMNDYESAANVLYDLIDKEYSNTRLNPYYIDLEVDNNEFTGNFSFTWDNIFDLEASEQITFLASSTDGVPGNTLDSLFVFYPEVQPSDIAVANWENQTYYHSNSLSKPNDMRGDGFSYVNENNYIASSRIFDASLTENGIISKYYLTADDMVKGVSICRDVDIYLKYAEAVNRLGKPNLAFAVLKYGLNKHAITSDEIVPKWEKYSSYTEEEGTFYRYLDFSDDKYLEQEVSLGDETYTVPDMEGVHARGCGNTQLADEYSIPELATLEDSILYVEEMIVEELALETAFEGNRFHDLMRISKHRGDNNYLADKVSEKYVDKEAIKAKLLDESNWYLVK